MSPDVAIGIHLASSLVCAGIAGEKDRGFRWAFLGLTLGVVGIVLMAFVPTRRKPAPL